MQTHKRCQFFVEPKMQLRIIFFNSLFMLLFAVLIGGGIYIGIWRSVVQQFSDVQLSEDLGEIKRIKEYEAARNGTEIASFPFLSDQAKLLSAHQQRILSEILANTNRQLIPVVVAIMALIVLISLLRSHKIAGPVVRLKRNLASIASGDLTQSFSLRKRDELKELSSALDKTVGIFITSLSVIKTELAKIENSRTDAEKQEALLNLKKAVFKYKYSDK